jgi:transposase-like protein
MGTRGCPPEFRRLVLDLVEAGRKIAEVAHDLGISDQTIYNWRRQDRIDRGLETGLTTGRRPSGPRPASGSGSSRPRSRCTPPGHRAAQGRRRPKSGSRPSR